MQFTRGRIFGHNGMNEEIAGHVTPATAGQTRFTPLATGSDRAGRYGNLGLDTADLVLNQGLLGSLTNTGKAIKDSLLGLANPSRRWGQAIGENLGIKGVGGAAADTLPAVKAGWIAGTNIEDSFRGAAMNRQLRQGVAPEIAAENVNKLHFDYDALTDFEKNYMRRLVPFYTFSRKNLPLQVETLLTQPGITANTYKPFNQEGDKGYIPQYLNSGAVIPLGPEKDGKRQYISKLGLPAEEAFEKLHFRNGLPDIGATALDFMSTLNPIIKAPLEQLFDTQFHTQRKFSDLKAPQAATAVGLLFGDDNPQLLGQIFANSPLTRFVSTADKLMDPRKEAWQTALNLGTGVRVTDVDTDKERAVELRSALEQMMKGHPHLSQYRSFYVKPDDVSKLTPDEILLMRRYSMLQDAAKQFAKSRSQVASP
jgi:hypothetical protein